MMKAFALFLSLGLSVLTGSTLFARSLSEAELRVEAETLAASKDVSTALGGERSLRSLEKVSFPNGDLWVAHFSPSGHAVLTNSTTYGLLVRFAEYDFEFPSEDSPGYLLLNAAAGAAMDAEAKATAGVQTASVQMSTEGKTYQNIPAITLTAWNQRGTLEWLPPRNAPGGCTAIAYGQIMRVLEWPVWLEEPVSEVLPYTEKYYQGPSILDDTYTIYPYTKIRYDWMTAAPYYVNDKGYQTLESTKLIMLVDIFSGMWFSEQGLSGAFIHDAATNPWYEPYVHLNSYNGSNFGPFLEHFYQAACEGIPICAEIDTIQGNHAIMITGWQGTPETARAYFNFGWGSGDSSGWYSLRLLSGSGYIMRAYLSRPKKTVQVAPLRKVSTNALELEWALPKCYDDDVNGFTVTVTGAGNSQSYEVDADARTWSPSTPLTEGETYTFTVTPHFIDSNVTALVSNTVETKILATADMEPRTLTFASREGLLYADMSFKDGAYRSVSFNGTSVIHVTAPASTKKLTIYSMRPDSFPASAITIHEVGEGKYDLVVDGSSAVLTRDRYENTRVLYTVCAEDEYGTITAKEMILCYNSIMPSETYETTPDPEPDPEPTMYTVQATIVGNGTVAGEGTYEAGTQVTLTATPAAGYAFSQWTMGADTLTTATLSFTLRQNINLTATFTQVVEPEPEPNPGTGGEGEDPDTGDEGDDPEPSTGYTGTFYVTGVTADELKYDANKTGQNDSALCWAYAFSGMIAWYQDMYSTTNAKGPLPIDYPRSVTEIVNVMKAYGNTPGSFPTAVNYYLQTREYLLPYITPTEWNMLAPKAYKGYAYSDSNSPLKSLEDFSQLLYDNLYKGPAFVDLLLENSVDGHAVTIWGATFKDGRVTSVYISDSDDNETTYKAYTVTCTDNRLRLEGHWAPRINALTFLWLPSGVTPVLPPEPEPEAPSETVVKLSNGHELQVPHTWVKEHFPTCTDFTAQLNSDSDGDGFTDAEEYFIGTNPTLKADRLKIEAITFDANGKPIFTISPKAPGASATFVLYGCETLNGTWKKHEDTDTTHRFFRIRVEPK